MRLAAIDIGTNSCLLLICEAEPGGRLRDLVHRERVTKLGMNLAETGRLAEESIRLTVSVLGDYVRIAEEMDASVVGAVATSATREAANRQDLLREVERQCGLKLRIISGEEEAALALLGVSSSTSIPAGSLLVVDVGGGSTEIILGRERRVIRWCSLPMGARRLTERMSLCEAPTEVQIRAFLEAVKVGLKGLDWKLPPHVTMVGTAGTAKILGTVAAAREGLVLPDGEDARELLVILEGKMLERDTVEDVFRRTVCMTHEERAAVYRAIAERLSVSEAEATRLKELHWRKDPAAKALDECLEDVLQGSAKDLMMRLRDTMRYWVGERLVPAVEHVFLTGGGSQVRGLAELLSNTLAVGVEHVAPVKTESSDILWDHRLSVAFGLSLRRF